MILNSLIKKLEDLEFAEVNLKTLQNLNIPNVKVTKVTNSNDNDYKDINIKHKDITYNITIYNNDKIDSFKKDYLKYWHKKMPLYELYYSSIGREIETIEHEDYRVCKLSLTDDFDYVIVDKES